MRIGASASVALAVAALAGLAAFCWPLLVAPRSVLGDATGEQGPFVFALVLPLVLLVTITQLTGDGIDVKGLAMLGVLTGIGAVLRPLSAGTAGLETVFFLIVLGGRVFGAGFGFLLGCTTLFTSALLTGGVGPWLPYQMLAAGFVGLGAALLPRLRGVAEAVLLAGYSVVIGFAYGWLMDLAFWPFSLGGASQLSYVPGAPLVENLHRFVAFNVATSMGWNLGRSLTTAALIGVLGPGVLVVLRRAARRAVITQTAS